MRQQNGICGWIDRAGLPEAAVIVPPQDSSLYRNKRDLFMVTGSPAWRDPELTRLAIARGPALALAEGYGRYGAAVLDQMTGPFALVVYEGESGKALLATDRSAICPLFYSYVDGVLLFGSRIDTLMAHPAARREIDRQSIFNYLYFEVVPGPETIYKTVRRLQPGHCAHLDKGRLDIRPYWSLKFDETSSPVSSPVPLQQEFRALLREAVDAAVADEQRVGAFLSGGTDSSTVAGLLGEVTDAPAKTYSIGFEADGYDELAYARIAARHFATAHHEYYVTPQDVTAAIPQIARHYDQPFGNASAIPTYYCARMAREDGVERLLGGDGGDELFGGNYRYAKQQLFEFYGRLPAGLRKAIIEPVVFSIPYGESLGPLRKLRNYVRQAKIPLPERLEAYNLLNQFGPQQVFTADYLDDIDCARPFSLLAQEYHGARASTALNRMLAVDMRFTLADSDLPKVNGMCELAGVEVTYPLLNDALVAFAARLPPEQKVNGTQLRYFFKQALRDFLPKEIQVKKKHGFGLPYGLWLQSHEGLRELTYDSLEGLKKRHIVRAGFIDKLIGERHAEHPAYYGGMVWRLMMLEQWLAAHEIQ